MSMMIPAAAPHPVPDHKPGIVTRTRECPGSFEALCAVAPLRTLEPREELFCEGSRRRDFYQVLTGALLQSRYRGDGSRQILNLALPGDFLSLPLGATHNCDVHALQETTLRCIPADAIRLAHLHGPGFLQSVCRLLSADVARLQSHMLIIGKPGAIQRVAALLIDLIARQHGATGSQLPCTIPLSRCDMGELLCISFESVSRAMTRLKRLGAVTMSDARTITDVRVDRLTAIASE